MNIPMHLLTLCLATIVVAESSDAWTAVCSSADYNLLNQADVDALGAAGCDEISGRLTISGADITNLEGLFGITGVGESLILTNNPDLTNLSGLGGIIRVEGALNIVYNPTLANLDGLSGITNVGGNMRISDNTALTNLDGLSELTSVGGGLDIRSNAKLTNVNGLSGMINVTDSLDIRSNNALTNLDGLSGVTSIGEYLRVNRNATLTNLDGLAGITNVGDYLEVSFNDALTNLGGLSSITSIGGYFRLTHNPVLTNLDGLSGVTSLGGDLNISFNAALTNLDGISSFANSMGRNLNISFNTALTNLDGLYGITSAVGAVDNLSIENNDALTNLDGLSGITGGLGGDLYILSNQALTNLNGLSGISSVGGLVKIGSSARLADCIGIAPLLGWPDGPPDDSVVGNITVQSNAPGCNSVEDILASVTGPTQPVITEVSTGNGYATLNFTPATATETLFPITGYEAACLGSEVANATSPVVGILDNSVPVESSLTISGYGSLATPNEIEVDINISHARPQHLKIQLTSPQGTTLTLWDESAQTATDDIVGTFPTTLTPLDSIDSIAGEMNGTWVLSVQDVNAIGGLEGVLNSWGLRIKENAKATGSSPITVTGLTNNRDYACTVTPVTKLGVFPASAAVTATPFIPQPPSAPVITSVEQDDSGLVVRSP